MQTAITTKPVQKLTDEFWYEMRKQFPDAMKVFEDWLVEYEKKNNWDDLFANDRGVLRPDGWYEVKYHHLPFAMQIGIWMEFVFDQGIYWVFDFSTDLKTDIRDFLAVLEVK